jgi:hypothetical protein
MNTTQDKPNDKRNKATICATVSPFLKQQLLNQVETKKFASLSDLVSLACQDYISRNFPDSGCESAQDKQANKMRTKEQIKSELLEIPEIKKLVNIDESAYFLVVS